MNFDAEWRASSAVSLPVAMYKSPVFDRMPVLADALEEAGCDHADVPDHCRGDGPHVRGVGSWTWSSTRGEAVTGPGQKIIRAWVEYAIADLGVPCRPLDGEAVERLVADLKSKYTAGPTTPFLWEAFRDDRSVRRSDGWRLAASYPRTGPCLMVCEGGRWAGWRFDDADGLTAVLAETPGFEFLVTDDGTSFVLCFNHHDYLIGVGGCREWLASIPDDGV